tara:strand:- start:586 stop:732 length:147 start_codon:yes stop_codon:yes gene_type:complete
MNQKKIEERIAYLKSELAHSGFHDGWVIKGLQEELNQLEARRKKNVKI